jgi:uncharacterized membrane protein
MDDATHHRRLTAGGLLLGVGLGGFFDGIVLHQILQWHHMVSHVDDYPTTTVAGLEANTLGDGLFHAATWIATVVGMILLVGALRRSGESWSFRSFADLLLMGWGLFNVVEGVVDHHLLGLHHVKERSDHRLAWDLAFLAWGGAMIVVGWSLTRGDHADALLTRGTDRPPATPIRSIDSSRS